MITKENRAYCAGLFEGEGSISFNNVGKSRKICLKIAMTDLHPLELFDDIMGYGRIYGPYPKGPGRKVVYEFNANGYERVQFIICQIWDWLSPRRKEQISIALKSYQQREMKQHSVGRWQLRRQI